jgi:hypothetical protein
LRRCPLSWRPPWARVKPNLLVSTNNITRGIGGQIRETVAATSRFKSFRNLDKLRGKGVFSFEDEKMVGHVLPNVRWL